MTPKFRYNHQHVGWVEQRETQHPEPIQRRGMNDERD
jgi:hypothetical protein